MRFSVFYFMTFKSRALHLFDAKLSPTYSISWDSAKSMESNVLLIFWALTRKTHCFCREDAQIWGCQLWGKEFHSETDH